MPNTYSESDMIVSKPENKNNTSWENPQYNLKQGKVELRGILTLERLGGAVFAQTDQQEFLRQKTKWAQTAHVLQGHFFDGVHEAADISLLDFLLRPYYKVISFNGLANLLGYW